MKEELCPKWEHGAPGDIWKYEENDDNTADVVSNVPSDADMYLLEHLKASRLFLSYQKECSDEFLRIQKNVPAKKNPAYAANNSIINVTNEVPQISNLVQVISQLKRIMKKLALLKMFKSRNRRIKWLCELAHKYLKMLVLEKPSKSSTSILGMSVTSADRLSSNADTVIEPVMDIAKVSIDKEIEDDCFPETSLKASTSRCYEALCLKGLPQRFHMPAPRMLCRPSALRWTKPCCTRSCNESLEHIITINYSECQKSCSKLD